jgi:tetratricopeptide (TPR) repeat protein
MLRAMRVIVRVIATCVLVCAALGGAAIAQPDEPTPEPDPGDGDAPATPDPKEAKRWLDAGDTLIKGGDKLARKGKADEAMSQYERALVSYQKAQELSGNPQVFFAIGAAYEKLGKQPEALLAYRKVTLQVQDKPQLVELATARMIELGQSVGLVTAKVEPRGANLLLDGEPIGEAPLPDPLVLNPGSYTLTIVADGYQPLEVKLDIEAGSESERTFKLEPVPVVFGEVKDAPPPDPSKRPPSPPSKVLLWGSAGAALVLAGVAATTGVMALSRNSTFEDPMSSEDEREAAKSSGKKLAVTSDVCLVGAVLAAGFTTYYYFRVYKPRNKRIQESRSKAAVVPWVQPTAGGLSFAVTY